MTSRSRVTEVKAFLDALVESARNTKMLSIELIFLDQSDVSIFEHLFERSTNLQPVTFIYRKISRMSLSQARNVGLNLANGEIYAFPDDDCVYPINLFAELELNVKFFKYYKCIAFNYSHSNLKEINNIEVSRSNLLGKTISFSIFVKQSSLRFNEGLGVGAKYGAGEESEYLLQLLDHNDKVLIVSDVIIYHPDFTNINLKRVRNYGLGFGALANIMVRDRSFSLKMRGIKLIFAPFIKSVLNIVFLRPKRFYYEINSFVYRIIGFCSWYFDRKEKKGRSNV